VTGNIYIDDLFVTAVSMCDVVLPKSFSLLSRGSVALASRAVYAFWLGQDCNIPLYEAPHVHMVLGIAADWSKKEIIKKGRNARSVDSVSVLLGS
jgi:hypothetical protein